MGENLYVIGNQNQIGLWKIDNAVRMRTSADMYPAWSSDAKIFFTSRQDVRNIEYKYVISHQEQNTVKWEKSSNRKIDLSNYFRDQMFTHVIIEDDEFDKVGSAPKVKVINGEATCETDSIIVDDLKYYQKNLIGSKDILLNDDVNLIINQSIVSSHKNQSLDFIPKMSIPADNQSEQYISEIAFKANMPKNDSQFTFNENQKQMMVNDSQQGIIEGQDFKLDPIMDGNQSFKDQSIQLEVLSSQIQNQQSMIQKLQHEVTIKDTQKKEINIELIKEKQTNLRQQEEIEKRFSHSQQNAIKQAQEDADKMNLQLRQEMILRQVVDRIRLQTVLKTKSDVQKAYYILFSNYKQQQTKMKENKMQQNVISMQKTLREQSTQMQVLEDQLKTHQDNNGNGKDQLKQIQKDLQREKEINLNSNVAARKFALRIFKQHPIKYEKQNLYKAFNCFLQNAKIQSYMQKQGNTKQIQQQIIGKQGYKIKKSGAVLLNQFFEKKRLKLLVSAFNQCSRYSNSQNQNSLNKKKNQKDNQDKQKINKMESKIKQLQQEVSVSKQNEDKLKKENTNLNEQKGELEKSNQYAMLEINKNSIDQRSQMSDVKNQQKHKEDTDKELEKINNQLKDSVDKLKLEQEKNEQNMKQLRQEYERQLVTERSKYNESIDLKHSYVSTEAKRIVRVQEVTQDSQENNKSIINDTLTDELDISVELNTSLTKSQLKKIKKKKSKTKKQYLDNSMNDSQTFDSKVISNEQQSSKLTHVDSEGSIVQIDLMRANQNTKSDKSIAKSINDPKYANFASNFNTGDKQKQDLKAADKKQQASNGKPVVEKEQASNGKPVVEKVAQTAASQGSVKKESQKAQQNQSNQKAVLQTESKKKKK